MKAVEDQILVCTPTHYFPLMKITWKSISIMSIRTIILLVNKDASLDKDQIRLKSHWSNEDQFKIGTLWYYTLVCTDTLLDEDQIKQCISAL